MGGTGVIDGFLSTFTQYINSGFGLVQGDVRWLAGVLIAIDLTLAGLFWAMAPDEDVLARLIRKTLYIGVFAFIIGNYNSLAKIIYNSFAGLGLEAGGGTLTAAQLLQPGKVAQVGIDAGKPILTSISGLMGFTSFFDNFIQIAILMIAWLIVVISFFIMAIQLFVSLIEFKLTTLAGFVLVPFGLFGRTAFLAEKVLGNVVSSGVKILVLAVIVGIGSTIFSQFTSGFNNPPTIDDALTLILAALAMLGLSIFGPGIANGLIAGGPQLGAGAAVGTGLAAAGVAAAGAGLAAAGVGAVGAAGSVIAGAARGGASLAGAATAAYRVGGLAGVAEAAGSAAASPLRSAATSIQTSFAAGEAAVAEDGAAAASAPASAEASGPPAWARRMKRARRNERADLGAGRVEILDDPSLDAHRVLESGSSVLPACFSVGEKLLRRCPARIGLRVGLGEGLIDRADAIGDPLRLGQELLGLRDRLFERGKRRIGQAREIARLIDQHGRLVLKAQDLVVDLLQLARGGQYVLGVIGRIEDDPLRARRHGYRGERQRCDAA